MPSDFVKALALGADGIALANSAMQAIGCIGARICNSNNCPVGIATQKPELRARLDIERSAAQLNNFLRACVDLMKVMARACGHADLQQFNLDDLATLEWSMPNSRASHSRVSTAVEADEQARQTDFSRQPGPSHAIGRAQDRLPAKWPCYLLNDLTPKTIPNLVDANGDPCATAAGVDLCRCGGSRNKPFCDGTRGEIGFTDEKNRRRQ